LKRLYQNIRVHLAATSRYWTGWRADSSKSSAGRKGKGTIQWGDESRLLAIATRLRMVQIEHDDAFAVIRQFDGPDALFYSNSTYCSP
jgi:hypothetical protein